MHADARASRRHQLRRELQRLLRREVEHRCDFRVLIRERLVLDHVLAGSHDPFRDQVLDVPVLVVPVLLQDTDPQQVVDDLLGLPDREIVALRQFFRCETNAALLKAQHKADFLLGEHPVKDPEIHVVFLHASRQLARNIVRDHDRQLLHQLGLLRVLTVVPVHGIVQTVHVDHRVDFLYHNAPFTRSES